MNNQPLENQPKAKIDATQRRRFLQKAGLAAPVILTFSSPAAFGGNALCFSQQMSGGVSNPTLSCSLGTYNPSGLHAENPFPSGPTYNGSSNFQSVFGGGSNDSFSNILTANQSSDEAIFITALMNADLSSGYVLTKQQVLDLYLNPGNRPAGYGSASAFLTATFP